MIRNWLYDRGLLRIERVNIPVISIGNISVGGTGKTPLVIFLAKQFPQKKVAILSRGYCAQKGELSDEMQLIRRHAPNALLYQGKDRCALAKRAQDDGADWILLDDGLQYRRLARDLDLAIVRTEDTADHFLPWGRLRDHPSRLQSCMQVKTAPKVLSLRDRFGRSVSSIANERIACFCGIGRPERFFKTMEAFQAVIVLRRILADHEPFFDIYSFFEKCKLLDVKYLVCTEKDFVKLPPIDLPLLWVEIEAEIEGVENLIEKIAATLNN